MLRCDVAHEKYSKGAGVQLALVIGLVALILIAATVTVAAQDTRAQEREATRRKARLTRLGEPPPYLAPTSEVRRRWRERE